MIGSKRATGLDATTLLAANVIILWVTAVALAVAGRGRCDEPYWESWIIANVVLGVALVVFIFERDLPPLLVATLPNGLLVLGFGLRWRAAREFGGRPASTHLIWGPFLAFVAVASLLFIFGYAPVFVTVNFMLAAMSLIIAHEFWRDRHDNLPSRYGLVAAYLVMGLSFGARVPLAFLVGSMPPLLAHDLALTVHLTIAVFHTVAAGAFALSLAYERSNARLSHAATHDALTGLLNRGAFEDSLRRHIHAEHRDGFALALLDMDHFKRINDEYGHAAGDEALRRFASIAGAMVDQRATLARVGGEEFALLLPDTTLAQARSFVERLRLTMKSAIIIAGDRHFRVTLSAGLCHSGDAPRCLDSLMRLADEALYAAKDGGRDRVEDSGQAA